MAKRKISKTEAQRRARSAAAAKGTSYQTEMVAVESTYEVISAFDYTVVCDTTPAVDTASYSDPGCY